MMKPGVPEAETRIVKMAIGYTWSYSFESGPTGDRQKLILTGNTEGMARAMTELRRAKISLMELAAATAEELTQPRYHDRGKMYKEEEGPIF